MLSHAEPEIVPFVYIIELVDVNRSVFLEKKVAVEAENWFVFKNLMNFEIVALLFNSLLCLFVCLFVCAPVNISS